MTREMTNEMTNVRTRNTKKSFVTRICAIALTAAILISTLLVFFSTKSSAGSGVSGAISWAVAIANDNSHGYSQASNRGPNYDCSSFVSSAFRAAGFNVPMSTAGNMKSNFTAAGFTWIPFSSTSQLRAGDILLRIGRHAEIYIGGNQNVGAHRDYGNPQTGDQNGREIAVTGYYDFSWDGILRYTGSSSGYSYSNGDYSTSSSSSSSSTGSFDSDATLKCSEKKAAVSDSLVKLTVDTDKNTSGYTYKFLEYDDSTKKTRTIQDYSSLSTATYDTGDAGTKTLYAEVKNSSGATDKVKLNYTVYSELLKADRFYSRDGTRVGTNKNVRLAAKAEEGTEKYTYKFMILDESTGKWKTLQDYSKDRTYTWNSGDAGDKTLCVQIKDSVGNVERKPLGFSVK